jgi:hypothetical protein
MTAITGASVALHANLSMHTVPAAASNKSVSDIFLASRF